MNDKEEYVIPTLKAVKEVLEEEGIIFWLDSGGLLGAVRDKKLIPWDHDVEVGVWEDELPRVLKASEKLKNMGFVVDYILCEGGEKSVIVSKDISRWVPVVIEIHVPLGDFAGYGMLIGVGGGRIREIFRRGMKYICAIISHPEYMSAKPPFVPLALHIFLYKFLRVLSPIQKRVLINVFKNFLNFLGYRWEYSRVPAHYFKNFDKITFYGMPFRTPAPITEYLEFRYGKNWKIPKKDWSTMRDDGIMSHLREGKND